MLPGASPSRMQTGSKRGDESSNRCWCQSSGPRSHQKAMPSESTKASGSFSAERSGEPQQRDDNERQSTLRYMYGFSKGSNVGVEVSMVASTFNICAFGPRRNPHGQFIEGQRAPPGRIFPPYSDGSPDRFRSRGIMEAVEKQNRIWKASQKGEWSPCGRTSNSPQVD